MKLIALFAILLLGTIHCQDFKEARVADEAAALSAEPVVDEAQTDQKLNYEVISAADWDQVLLINKKCWEQWPVDPTQPACGKRGMTWAWYKHLCAHSIDNFGCGGLPLAPTASGMCDAYNGDTDCQEYRQILCINKRKINRPAYDVDCTAHAMPKEFYCGWTGAFYDVTPKIQGCRLTSRSQADQFCRYYFGCGWQMAEHGDAWWIDGMSSSAFNGNDWVWKKQGGWSGYGFSNINKVCTPKEQRLGRFWVAINSQKANCWN